MLVLLFGPAFQLLARTSFRFGFIGCGVLAVLSMAMATARPLPDGNEAVAWAGIGLVAYLLAAMHVFIKVGIGRTVGLANRIAAGELVSGGVQTEGVGGADAERMWQALVQMSESLRQIVQQVRSSAEAIANGSRSIAAGNADLAQRTHEQAAALEETAAGMDQLAAGARQNADSCRQALDRARRAGQAVAGASERMGVVTSAMERIDESGRQVGDILATVEGLAFQTNILALNAAVEAARAGDSGRGFAVVAAEVRMLAQRSAVAARDIKVLISQSSGNTAQGRKVVHEAAASFRHVIEAVQEVGAGLEAIARTSAEQSSAIEEIRRAMTQIDDTTQQNAALVEQATAAADAFEQETGRLMKVVRRFKADRGDDRARIVRMVKRAVRHLKEVGVQRGCADLNDPAGKFVRGEDYVFVFDTTGKRLALATDPSRVGMNDIDMRDADGTYYVREIIEAASNAAGFGWCEYRFPNPRTGRVEAKSVYVERLGDLVLGCGIYQGDDTPAPVAGRSPTGARGAKLLPAS